MAADNRPFVFVIIPFSEEFDNIYDVGIKLACDNLDLRCERVHDQTFEDHIVEQIYSSIRSADLIIADLSDLNPNVYYELGYARAIKKRIISMSRDVRKLPFDLRSYPALEYGDRDNPEKEVSYSSLRATLEDKIQSTINLINQTGDDNTPVVFSASRKIQGEQLDALFISCEEELWFCGIHFQWSISDHRAVILKELESGTVVNYIVIDPGDDAVIEKTARMISVPEDELRRECEDGFRKLEHLNQQAVERSCSGNLNVYVSNREPLGRYYLFDPHNRNGSVLVTPYAFELRSSHSPSYLYKARSEVAQSYVDSCARLREASRKYDFTEQT